MTGRRPVSGLTSAHGLLALLSGVAGSSLTGAISGSALWPATCLGVVVALVAAVATSRLRLLTTESLALSIVLMLLTGGVVIRGVPDPAAMGTFFHGLVEGWADLLSSQPPVAATGQYLVLPYVLAWLAATVGFALLRHVSIPGIAALGPVTAFGVGLLFSVELRTTSLIQGALIVALALALGWYQQGRAAPAVDARLGATTIARRRARVLYGLLVLGAAAVVAPVIAAGMPGFDDRDRFDLRDRLVPPWNPLDEPSPLAPIKGNYADAVRDDPVFVARGSAIPDRWALATLSAYDGTVWTVGDSALGGEAPFVQIEGTMPPDPALTGAEPMVDVEVEIVELDGPWLPLPGRARELTVDGIDPTDGQLRANLRTGTVAVPAGAEGLTYAAAAYPWPVLTDDEMAALTLVQSPVLGLDQQASTVRNWAADQVEGVDAGWPQVQAVRDALRRGGYLADERALPGHSWARLAEFFADDEEFFGNEEQYAAVAAIAVRNAGFQSRVVVGFRHDLSGQSITGDEVTITRADASAWIEVQTVERGWLPVDVTPDRDQVPTFEEQGRRKESVAAPNPPPPPPPPPAVDVALEPEENDEKDEDAAEEAGGSGLVRLAVAAAMAPVVPLVLLGSWLVAMTALKQRRRRRRRRHQDPNRQVVGAWAEAADRCREAGARLPHHLSVREQAVAVDRQLGVGTALMPLVDLVDRAAFSPGGIDADGAATAWQQYEVVTRVVGASDGPIDRARRLGHPGPLLRRGRS